MPCSIRFIFSTCAVMSFILFVCILSSVLLLYMCIYIYIHIEVFVQRHVEMLFHCEQIESFINYFNCLQISLLVHK